MTLNKKDLVKKVYNKMEKDYGKKLSLKDIDSILSESFSTIEENLIKGNPVRIFKFGTFSIKTLKERKGRNPQTGDALTIPESYTIKFKTSKFLKDKITKIIKTNKK